MAPNEPTGRARLPAVMERALEIAAKGECLTFNDIRARLSLDDATTLKLWAGASDRDKIEKACREGADRRYRSLGIKVGRTRVKR
jgi:hypothetical protein